MILRNRKHVVLFAVLAAAVLVAAIVAGCQSRAVRRPVAAADAPSIVVVVVDTLRADAVSAYGEVSGTTPNIDALAERGLRYQHAYAPAPWSIPSHVSLFSGLGPERHGIGLRNRAVAPEELKMLAERLRDAGYETAGFVENTLISAPFGMEQGFDHFRARSLEQTVADMYHPGSTDFSIAAEIEHWVAQRDKSRPFFVFVNLFDAHEPYPVRDENPFLPAGVTKERASGVEQSLNRICDRLPPAEELAILRGLYLGDVAAADALVGKVHQLTTTAAGDRQLISVVTSDHGEHLGEHRLIDHSYTVYNPALRIPLIVSGVRDIDPAVIDARVTLTDVTASVLQWANVPADDIDGVPLPRGAVLGDEGRALLSMLQDIAPPPDWPFEVVPLDENADAEAREHCGSEDRVFGEMVAVIRYPYKLNWYARYPAQLYNIEEDPREEFDLASAHPDVVERLSSTAQQKIRAGQLGGPEPVAIDSKAREALRVLGYED
ncbi:MAG TPA: sulfatase [Terriglobales bacterium]|nr:sulfatase [Terriglobales bacterium]